MKENTSIKATQSVLDNGARSPLKLDSTCSLHVIIDEFIKISWWWKQYEELRVYISYFPGFYSYLQVIFKLENRKTLYYRGSKFSEHLF